jgi:Zn-dependent protease/CBS domain-containing protein
MNWSFRVARITGIEVRIHVAFLLVLALYSLSALPEGGVRGALAAAVLVSLVFLCVLLHEFGHAYAALAYGIRTPDITLHFFGGIARLERMPEKPWQEVIIALAGPMVNVVIAGALFLALGHGMRVPVTRWFAGDTNLLATLFSVNVMLVLFNLIPAFPMDGGRVLRALLATRLPYVRATAIAARIGQFFAFVFGAIGLFGIPGVVERSPVLIFVAFFVYMAASQESSAVQMRDLTRSVRLTEAMITDFKALPLDATLGDAVALLLRGSQHEFPVVEDNGRVRGVLTREDLVAALSTVGQEAAVVDHMRHDVPTIPFNAPFAEACQLMEQSNSPVLPVVDRENRLVGLLTAENVGEMMMIQSILARDGKRPSWRTARSA